MSDRDARPEQATPTGSQRPPTMSVAIVGMACRVPGAEDPEQLWDNLCSGLDAITDHTIDDLVAAGADAAAVVDPQYVRCSGKLGDIADFDAGYFGYNSREADVIDPQQRILLECCQDALDRAGYPSGRNSGRVGAYLGVGFSEYLARLLPHVDQLVGVDRYQLVLGNDKDFAATRVGYKLDLKGPCLTVQTACSTSLVAVCTACESLLSYQSDLALAGGACVRVPDVRGYRHQAGGILSRDGRCRAFDTAATGTSVGSGAGVVVLKRLDDALADRDTIHAVIRGYAVNNDGATKAGFAAPSVDGQVAVIRESLAMADADPASIGFVETHGTGTVLGDRIELAALREVFGGERDRRLRLGALKTNVGHLDIASGVAGLIKAALVVERGVVPPTLHLRTPQPGIGDGGPFAINTATEPWNGDGGCRLAGVSSFGIGGTNAHVTLEQPPAVATRPESPGDPMTLPTVLLLSARTPQSADRLVGDLAEHLAAQEDRGRAPRLEDVAFTLVEGRERLDNRRAVVCRPAAEATTGRAGLAGAVDALRDRTRVISGHVDRRREVAMLLPGFGVQVAPAAGELYVALPEFRETVAECAAAGRDVGVDVLGALGIGDRAGTASFCEQLAGIYVFEVALTAALAGWGIRPVALIGHSLGEYAAACLAGVFSAGDGLRLVIERGRLMTTMPRGAMISAAAGEDRLRWVLRELLDRPGDTAGDLAVASVNAPEACLLSGTAPAVDTARAVLDAHGIAWRAVPGEIAAHSGLVEPIRRQFEQIVAGYDLAAAKVPIVSGPTGVWAAPADHTDPGYWGAHLRDTARLADGLATLLARPDLLLLEVGPGRGMASFAKQSSGRRKDSRIRSCRSARTEGASAVDALVAAVAELWTDGVDVDWGRHLVPGAGRVPLPTYPYVRRRHWIDPPGRREPAGSEPVRAVPDMSHQHRAEFQRAEIQRAAIGQPGRGPHDDPGDLASDLELAVLKVWRNHLGSDCLGLDDDFLEAGGDSLLAVRLSGRLSALIGRPVTPDMLARWPTPRRLAAGLADSGGEAPSLVPLRDGDARRTLFCIHPAGGHVLAYQHLARLLPEGPAIAGLAASGLRPGASTSASVQALAAEYLAVVRTVQPAGPYYIAGLSFGGMVGFEMAQRLRCDGHEVAFLGLLDTPGPGCLPERLGDDAAVLAYLAGPQTSVTAEQLRGMDVEDRFEVLLALPRLRRMFPAELGPEQARRYLDVFKENVRAMYDYVPRRYPGRIHFYRAADRTGQPVAPQTAWSRLTTQGIECRTTAGDHSSMVDPPHVVDLGNLLAADLEACGWI